MNFITQINVPVKVLINYFFSFYRLIDFAINFLCFINSLMLNIHNIKRSISHTYCFKHYTVHTTCFIYRNPFLFYE